MLRGKRLARRDCLKLCGAAACSARSRLTTVMAMPHSTSTTPAEPADTITLFLCGDVMLGRGIDQILPHPGDARLHERQVHSAITYVQLAERVNGPIPRPVDFPYVWGDALEVLRRVQPDLRIINLETSITRSPDFIPKGINYKMSPDNAACLTAAGIDGCVLANNHVLDWGRAGLLETLETLEKLGVKSAGAGRNAAQAEAPAVLEVAGKGRVLVFGFGSQTSGIPRAWAAAESEPGVNMLKDLSERTIARIADRAQASRRPGDLLVASIHWGGNWGYDIPAQERRFAHGLIEGAGFDVVHGHSSHHPKGIEVYRDRPILYGCGDFLNDYEGIAGYEAFRDDLTLMYLPTLSAANGRLISLRLVPFQIRKLRLHRAPAAGGGWLRDVLNRESASFGVRLEPGEDDTLSVSW
jgi:poly-gamma-glutamate synthesis protein (capsule biosynthesis protein)